MSSFYFEFAPLQDLLNLAFLDRLMPILSSTFYLRILLQGICPLMTHEARLYN
ncbi:unnamed protein product [Meloidogyne enterolobii]|uniref:Uncharacterized protein n=1 Tax=Meloidogyne enterolobii TaxID=390850 RepID=A0ACB0ZFR0_MELEN